MRYPLKQQIDSVISNRLTFIPKHAPYTYKKKELALSERLEL